MAAPMASREEVRSAEELSGSHTMVMGSVDEAASPPAEAEAVSAPAAAPEPPAVQPVKAPNMPAIASAALPATNWRLLKNPSAIVAFLSYPRRNRRDRIRLRHGPALRPTCENHRKKGR